MSGRAERETRGPRSDQTILSVAVPVAAEVTRARVAVLPSPEDAACSLDRSGPISSGLGGEAGSSDTEVSDI